MARLHHPRLRARIAILTIVALLWSQLAMAGHSICALGNWKPAVVAVEASVSTHCHESVPVENPAVCDAHCSQSDQSNEVGRVPLVPALACASSTEFAGASAFHTQRNSTAELPPPVSWHRPTPHPASLLLI